MITVCARFTKALDTLIQHLRADGIQTVRVKDRPDAGTDGVHLERRAEPVSPSSRGR